MARLIDGKGVDILARAMAALTEQLHLTVTGDIRIEGGVMICTKCSYNPLMWMGWKLVCS